MHFEDMGYEGVCTGLSWRPRLNGLLSNQVLSKGGNSLWKLTKITFSRTQFHGLSYICPCYVKLQQPAEQATSKK
jgi:hypothetical protein